LLFLDQLTETQRGGGLRGQIGQKLAIVGRVLLFREPGAEVEQSDQLALAHEGDDDLDPRVLQRGQAR
jgi:hypothetical protein